MKFIKYIAVLSLVVLFSGCALVSKKNIKQGNVQTLQYGLLGGWIPLYSSTETIEK